MSDLTDRLRRKVCIKCERPSTSLLCLDCSVEEFRERLARLETAVDNG